VDEEAQATQATINRITWLEQKSLSDLKELETLLDSSVTDNKSVKLNLDLPRELFGDQPVQFILAEVREVINFKNLMSIV
jgi:hypothetical protein